MNVLHMTPYTDNFYQHLMDALARCGAEQRILIPTTKKGAAWTERYRPLQQKSTLRHALRRRFIWPRNNDLYSAFADDIAKFKPDLIHAHTAIRGGSLALLVKEKAAIKYIVSVRSTDIRRYLVRSRRHAALFLRILQEAEHVIFINPSLKEEIYRRLPECREVIKDKASVIGNGVDDFWLKNAKPARQTMPESARLVQAGIISSRKNQLATFKAVELLNKGGIEARVVFVGREKEREKGYVSGLKKYISGSCYGEKATFIPHQSRDALVELYGQSDIFIMPSIRETFGISYIEALSQGLPVIYSRGRGVDGVFDEQVGSSADPDDPESIAGAIQRVMANYTQLSENASQEVRRFDWQTLAEKLYSEIYCAQAVGSIA